VDHAQGRAHERVAVGEVPPGRVGLGPGEPRAQGGDEGEVEQPVEHHLLARLAAGDLGGEQVRDRGPGLLAGQRGDAGQRGEQPAADVAGDLVGAAGDDRGAVRHPAPPRPERAGERAEAQVRGDVDTVDRREPVAGADDGGRGSAGIVGHDVVPRSLDHGDVAGADQYGLGVAGNDPGVPAQCGGEGQRRLVGDPHGPRRLEDGLTEGRGAGPDSVEQVGERVHDATA
jgi:hypothetical protein